MQAIYNKLKACMTLLDIPLIRETNYGQEFDTEQIYMIDDTYEVSITIKKVL